MSIALLSHTDCHRHELKGHPESPARLRAIMQHLQDSGLRDELQFIDASPVQRQHLVNVHPADHVDAIAGLDPQQGRVRLDADTFMSVGSLQAARLAAGALVDAVDLVADGVHRRAFCAVRPPGHHAELATAMGFCIFNNVVIGAIHALARPDIERVAILDFDVHHCNGTVDICRHDERILVCSTFQHPWYPGRYADYQADNVVNSPLAEGSGSREFRAAVERDWLRRIDEHRPQLIFVSAGFDAHRDDPLGGLLLEDEDYRWVTRQIVGLADSHAGGRVVSTLEGGYDLEALARCVGIHVAALVSS